MHEASPLPIRKPHHFLTALAWLLVVCIAGGIYLYQGGYLAPRVPKSLKPITTSPAGYILLNLSYGNGRVHSYSVNVSDASLNRMPFFLFAGHASLDGRYLMSAGAHTNANNIVGDIYRYDTSLATTTLFASGAVGLPRFPMLSPDGTDVVFNTPPVVTNNTTAMTPGAWSIYLATASGVPQAIAHGLYPQWSPDGSSILYVGDEGLRVYNIASSTDTMVYPLIGGTSNSLMTLSVSHDGTHLVWADPYHEKLMIARIYSWYPFSASVEKMLTMKAFFPVYSPDGTHVAFEQINPITSSSSSTNAAITLLDTSTFATTNLIHLSAFNQDSFLMTDWVNHL